MEESNIIPSQKNQNTLQAVLADFFYERIGDPLWRTYIFFFCIVNWKAIVALLFGKEDNVQKRINIVESTLKESSILSFNLWEHGYLLWPLIFTVIYILYLKFFKPKIVGLFTKWNTLTNDYKEENLKKQRDEIQRIKSEYDKLLTTYIENNPSHIIELLSYFNLKDGIDFGSEGMSNKDLGSQEYYDGLKIGVKRSDQYSRPPKESLEKIKNDVLVYKSINKINSFFIWKKETK